VVVFLEDGDEEVQAEAQVTKAQTEKSDRDRPNDRIYQKQTVAKKSLRMKVVKGRNAFLTPEFSF
jgi:hypothetical protein